jgi:hypothetical protein
MATDGLPKFDLTKFDQSYFDRLRARVIQLYQADIYVGVYLFTGEWVESFRCNNGKDGYPFSGANNVNEVTDGGSGTSSVTMTEPNVITHFQDAYIRKTIDTLNDLPNVLWMVSEEAPMWNDSEEKIRNYFWENFASGNSVVFMDPYKIHYPREGRNLCGSPLNGICSGVDKRWENARATMGYIRSYADRMNLIKMTPQPTLSSTGVALANTAGVGSEVFVYSPSGGAFSVDLSFTTHPLNVEWLNPATGEKTAASTVTGGSVSQPFNPPFSGDAVLYLYDPGV